jgi:D-alanine-D-alanine ligase
MKKLNCVILYNQLSDNPAADEADVLDQVKVVGEMLTLLGVSHTELTFSLRLDLTEEELKKRNPDFVFNLVESINNNGKLLILSPALLAAMNLPFSGGSLEATFITTSKVLTKDKLLSAGIPTAKWISPKETQLLEKSKRYILKPIWEDGSLGIDEANVFWGHDEEYKLKLSRYNPAEYFIEEYIDGREFNISVMATENGPLVLTPAEMQFINYPEGKPKVMGYTSKWTEDTFEYESTRRTFDYQPEDSALVEMLKEIVRKCWKIFGLNGYARVDLRVDKYGNPFVLEINSNPCISPDSGFHAACMHDGIPYHEAFRRIVNDIPNLKHKI